MRHSSLLFFGEIEVGGIKREGISGQNHPQVEKNTSPANDTGIACDRGSQSGLFDVKKSNMHEIVNVLMPSKKPC
jgi:hypothetical protein